MDTDHDDIIISDFTVSRSENSSLLYFHQLLQAWLNLYALAAI